MAKNMLKRNLLTSLVATALSASMLVGTTFAWFTDSVTSTNNVIKTGNLDVELYYQSAETTDWTPVGEDTNVFMKNTLWEPGHTEVVKLKVANEGTLALKYQLGVNVASETVSKNVNGEELKLSDHIKYGVVSGNYDYDRAEAIEAVENVAVPLNNAYVNQHKLFAYDGDVSTADENVVTMVVYMPEEVGDEANYAKGEEVPQIKLGINVFATQVTQESDSFDAQYDEYSAAFTVAEANALLAKGESDVTLIGTQEVDAVLEVPASFDKKLTVFNSTLKAINAEGDLDLAIYGDVSVNAKGNARTANVVASAISANGELTISGNGNLTAIAADVNGGFGIGGMNATSVAIEGITIDYVSGAYAYQAGTDTKYYKDAPEGGAAIGSGYDGAVITLNDVTVTKAIGGSKAAGIGARYHVGVTVNVVNSEIEYVEGGVSAAGIGGSRISGDATESGTVINITGSTVTAKGGAYGAGIGSGYDTHCLANQPLCTIVITGSTINATGGKYAAGVGTGYHHAALAGEIVDSEVNAVSGEKFYKEAYTSAMDVGFGVTDPAREGQQTDSKLIVDGKEITLASAPYTLKSDGAFDEAVKAGTKNIVLQGGDYSLSSLSGKEGITIVGAEDGSTMLAAVNSFNFGKDTVLKNVTFKTSGANSVRYATTSGNVVYENCVFEGKEYGYHVDNANGGTITFNNCVFYGRNAFAGNGTYFFNECEFKYTYSNYNTLNIYSEATFEDCTWDSKLELFIESGAKAIVDGDVITQRVVFIADARALEYFQQDVNWRSNTYQNVVVMLSADIDMKDAYYAKWTPIGQTGATQFQGTFDGHGYTIKNLNIDTSTQTGANYSTGLFGWINNATIKNLTIDTATVKGNHNVGVIAGYMETAGCTISNCHVINATVVANHANNDACGDKVGVIVGHAGNAGVKVENCSAKDSTVTAGRDAGQITGAALTQNIVGCVAENVVVTAKGDCTGANIRNEIIGRVL